MINFENNIKEIFNQEKVNNDIRKLLFDDEEKISINIVVEDEKGIGKNKRFRININEISFSIYRVTSDFSFGVKHFIWVYTSSYGNISYNELEGNYIPEKFILAIKYSLIDNINLEPSTYDIFYRSIGNR